MTTCQSLVSLGHLCLKGVRQVFITHASHLCSQYSFGLPLTMNGMHRTQFDHACLDLLSLIIWSGMLWLSFTWNLPKAKQWSKRVLTLDGCCPHSVTGADYNRLLLCNLWLLPALDLIHDTCHLCTPFTSSPGLFPKKWEGCFSHFF